MKTKSHVRFFSRVSHLDADIELVDVIKILSCNGELHEQNETKIKFLNMLTNNNTLYCGRENLMNIIEKLQ